ncbi:MAG: molybdopterin-dependent oxidoreductase [Candidatus Binatia bacterium]
MKSFCRVCAAFCAIEVDVDAGRVVAVRGDRSDPMSRGYTCAKGRQLPFEVNDPARLHTSLVRSAAGTFAPITSERAMDEIAQRLADVIDRHGPRAVASYSGTAAYFNAATLPVVRAWHRGIGSPMNCSSVTIDQPSKIIAVGRQGFWGGGPHAFATADVVMLIGNNPLVSALHQMGGPPGFYPAALREAKQRGLKLICVDPRRTETARLADIHLPVQPGEDPTLLAGMLRVILGENRHDAAFCQEHTAGLEALRDAVAGFTPDYVERRAGVPADRMIAAARLFAAGPRGCASSGTGPDMAPRPNLSEHLISCLNTVCGRWAREGERVNVPGVLSPWLPRPAQAFAPEMMPPEINLALNTERSRIRGLRQVYGEMPTAALADEILQPGDGQVRALIVVSGSPVAAWPDQAKTVRALAALDLLVCLDITMNSTCRRAHYVIGCRHPLERDDLPDFQDRLYERPYSHYARAVVDPVGDLIEERAFFAGLARRMGTPIELAGGPLDTATLPSTLETLELIYPGAKVPVRTIAEHEGGHVFDEIDVVVGPPIPGLDGRLQLTPDGVVDELRAVRAEPVCESGRFGRGGAFSHLLVCSRLKHVMNSVGHAYPQARGRGTGNPAFIHPDDLAQLGLASGDVVDMVSEDGAVAVVVAACDDMRRGTIALAHAFGADPAEEADVRQVGSNVGRLISAEHDYDPIAGMARQSAIPVRLRRPSRGRAPC